MLVCFLCHHGVDKGSEIVHIVIELHHMADIAAAYQALTVALAAMVIAVNVVAFDEKIEKHFLIFGDAFYTSVDHHNCTGVLRFGKGAPVQAQAIIADKLALLARCPKWGNGLFHGLGQCILAGK